MINVTKTFLPPFDEYERILKRAWDKAWITNNGELVQELEEKLKKYLDVKHLFYCNNGTVVLQMALQALDLHKEIITTPFSYVATTNTILWEKCKPVFVDIEMDYYCIDPSKIEAQITENTQAILATHVYGLPCDVIAIENIAAKYDLKVIYDGAHAFGTEFLGKPLLSYGDISTCSFHATKLFHTVEGGCVITNNDEIASKLYLYRQFGHINEDHFTIGINGKSSEFHAAMGLCNYNYLPAIIADRKRSWSLYKTLLNGKVTTIDLKENINYNYSYFPIVFKQEQELLKVLKELKLNNIVPRRYFYPSLNTLSYVDHQPCPNSESIASRVLCLPLYYEIPESVQEQICEIILGKITS